MMPYQTIFDVGHLHDHEAPLIFGSKWRVQSGCFCPVSVILRDPGSKEYKIHEPVLMLADRNGVSPFRCFSRFPMYFGWYLSNNRRNPTSTPEMGMDWLFKPKRSTTFPISGHYCHSWLLMLVNRPMLATICRWPAIMFAQSKRIQFTTWKSPSHGWCLISDGILPLMIRLLLWKIPIRK